MYVCTYVRTCVYMSVNICVYMYVCTYVGMCVYVSMSVNICVYRHVFF